MNSGSCVSNSTVTVSLLLSYISGRLYVSKTVSFLKSIIEVSSSTIKTGARFGS